MDFAKQKQTRLAELEQAFLLAMRQSKFEDALRFAKTALELDPTNPRYKEFVPLLEEKIALAVETDDDDEDDDTPEGEAGGHASGDEESGEGEDETSDEDEEEAEGEENSADEASEAGPADEEVDSIALDAKNLKLTKEGRNKLRESLRRGIQDLKEKELIAKLQASDPLLG